MVAVERKVSASTHNQALSAILFLYREVLAIKLPWLDDIGRPQQKRRIPSVLTKDEVAGLLAQMDGITALLAKLLYGTGMRLMEGLRLRVKDVDFERQVIQSCAKPRALSSVKDSPCSISTAFSHARIL
jgi:integrase